MHARDNPPLHSPVPSVARPGWLVHAELPTWSAVVYDGLWLSAATCFCYELPFFWSFSSLPACRVLAAWLVMVFMSLYRRPAYVPKQAGIMGYGGCSGCSGKGANERRDIPDGLSFDQVIDGTTLPPASLADFMVYLLYVSRDAENLQFFLWLRDYTTRFNRLSKREASLSPEWQTATRTASRRHNSKSYEDKTNIPFRTHVSNESLETDGLILEKEAQMQPYRAEVDRITQHYLLPGAPRELNLSYRVREAVLQALENTTHPSAFKPCGDLVEQCLRNQSHPNFIRWAMENGRRPRTIILRLFCVASLLFYLIGTIFLILSCRTRWLRLALSPVLFTGLLLFQAVFHGFCLLLYARSAREMRLWEMFASDEEVEAAKKSALPWGIPLVPSMDSTDANSDAFDTNSSVRPTTSDGIIPHPQARLNPFGPRNDFEHESWREKWGSISRLKKFTLTFTSNQAFLADRAITAYQRRIALQSVAIAAILTVIISAAAVGIPQVALLK